MLVEYEKNVDGLGKLIFKLVEAYACQLVDKDGFESPGIINGGYVGVLEL